MKTLPIVLAILFIATLTVYSQPAMNTQSGTAPDFDPERNSRFESQWARCRSCFQYTIGFNQTEITSFPETHSFKENNPFQWTDLSVDLTQTWSSSVWVNSVLDSIITNSYGEPTKHVNQAWYNTGWLNYYRDSYTYDANGNLTS